MTPRAGHDRGGGKKDFVKNIIADYAG